MIYVEPEKVVAQITMRPFMVMVLRSWEHSNTLITQVEPPAQEAIMKVMVAVLILTEGSPTAILAPFR